MPALKSNTSLTGGACLICGLVSFAPPVILSNERRFLEVTTNYTFVVHTLETVLIFLVLMGIVKLGILRKVRETGEYDRVNLIFGYAVISFLSIIFQFLFWFYDYDGGYGSFFFALYVALCMIVYCLFVFFPSQKYIFYYGGDGITLRILLILNSFLPFLIVKEYKYFACHTFNNAIFSIFMIELHTVIKRNIGPIDNVQNV